MKLGIMGSGFVGSAVGRIFAENGHDVIFYDVNEARIEELKKHGYAATADIKEAVERASVYFVCVPTPSRPSGKIDLSYVRNVTRKMGKLLRNRKDYWLVVVKSTVIPTTTENIIVPLLEKTSGKKAGADFGVCFNPEFLQEKKAYEHVKNPDRIVIGEIDKKSGDILQRIYRGFLKTDGKKTPIIRTNPRTAEMSKYANNNFYSTKISFFNEIAMMSEMVGGIDHELVRKVVQLDRYYGIHPWEHGHSFGGKCLPKELDAMIAHFNHGGIHKPILLKAVKKVNEQISTFKE
jgi:UDPglucose 6-dehydrogenase